MSHSYCGPSLDHAMIRVQYQACFRAMALNPVPWHLFASAETLSGAVLCPALEKPDHCGRILVKNVQAMTEETLAVKLNSLRGRVLAQNDFRKEQK